jgi:ketosteroid isomerase-like protein
MAIKTHTHVRAFLWACLIAPLIITTGCQQQSSPPHLSAAEVKKIAAEFKRVSSAHIQAWNDHSLDELLQLYTDDINYYEGGSVAMSHDKGGIVYFQSTVLSGSPDIAGRQVDAFIGRQDGMDIWEMWNYSESTKADPYYAYDWFTLREGKIATYYLFWGAKAFAKDWIPGGVLFTQKSLRDYQAAWSSGDPQAVASLYAPQAVRQDTLFRENQTGSPAVKDYAAKFFSWYPGVRLELLESFELATSDPLKTGGVFVIHASDRAGQPCDVRAIIVLDTSEAKIINEWIFYQADSLLACGWAR